MLGTIYTCCAAHESSTWCTRRFQHVSSTVCTPPIIVQSRRYFRDPMSGLQRRLRVERRPRPRSSHSLKLCLIPCKYARYLSHCQFLRILVPDLYCRGWCTNPISGARIAVMCPITCDHACSASWARQSLPLASSSRSGSSCPYIILLCRFRRQLVQRRRAAVRHPACNAALPTSPPTLEQ
jgi:hypothetical protein